MKIQELVTNVIGYLVSSNDERVVTFVRGEHMFVSGTYNSEPETQFLQLVELPAPVAPGTIVSQEQYERSMPLIRIEFNDLGSLEALERAIAVIRKRLTPATEATEP